MRQEELLINRLAAYTGSDMYPFHMLGYKRTPGIMDGFADPWTVGITEIDGFDSLHRPEGILGGSVKRAVDAHGADQTYYLIDGGTSGTLTAMCGTAPRGGRILVSRDYHRFMCHGIYLNRLRTSYVYPQEMKELETQRGITAEDVDRMFKRCMDTQAVLIVCPTYDGIVSGIETITQIVHRTGLPLIMDEAHGARFQYDTMFPAFALDLGADVVIQSMYKALPSPTQTALFHIECNRSGGGYYADRERIGRYFHMVQSSNSSYLLMASIESSIFQAEYMDMMSYGRQFHKLRLRLGQMRHLRLAGIGIIEQTGIRDLDIFKIMVSTRGIYLASQESRDTGLTDIRPDDILHREYHLEMEMCGADYMTVITATMGDAQGPEHLGSALIRIDSCLASRGSDVRKKGGKGSVAETDGESSEGDVHRDGVYSMRCDTAMSMDEAMNRSMKSVGLEGGAGCISGEFTYICPPGILIVAPGEWISGSTLGVIPEYRDKGLPVQDPTDKSPKIICMVQKD